MPAIMMRILTNFFLCVSPPLNLSTYAYSTSYQFGAYLTLLFLFLLNRDDPIKPGGIVLCGGVDLWVIA